MAGSIQLRWPIALATVPAVLAGCTDNGGGDQGFRITSVAFDNDSTITLTFSAPVADVGGVDPNDFRLSIGQTMHITYSYGGMSETYMSTSYEDVSGAAYGYSYGGEGFTFMTIEPGASANQVVLRSTMPLGPDACDYVDYVRSNIEMYADNYAEYITLHGFDIAIFLHYAASDIPIESSDTGSVLANIGADWVLNDENYLDRENVFGFTMLSPQLRIPCPTN